LPLGLRLAVVEYRDHPPQDNTFAARAHAFTADLGRLRKTIDGLKPEGGGDAPESVFDGLRAACDELFATEDDGARGAEPVVVVSHVSPIKAATCWALGLGDQGAWRLYLATASMTRIGWGIDGPVLNRFNETPWSDPG